MIKKEDIVLINKYRNSDILSIPLNNNEPNFTKDKIKRGLIEQRFEDFFELDEFMRCTGAFACIIKKKDEKNTDSPKHNRHIKPTAWRSIKCEDIKDGGYLYNRCHLIGCQLATKKANRRGLITGTRDFNINGMFEFEDKVEKYIEQNADRPILYRVIPYFKGENLLACGVKMEAFSVMDNGRGLSYNVFVYNRQPQFTIDYKTGEVYSDSCMSLEGKLKSWNVYLCDRDTKRFRIKPYTSVCNIKRASEMYFAGEKQTLIERGYS